MMLIRAKTRKLRPRKRLAVGGILLCFLGIIGGATTTAFQASAVEGMIKSAKAEIEDCTLRGVGVSIANGQFSLSLPAGCRLAG